MQSLARWRSRLCLVDVPSWADVVFLNHGLDLA
jgi:hypothetical protein